MNEEQAWEILGESLDMSPVAGEYGMGIITMNRFVVADLCYIDDDKRIGEALTAAHPRGPEYNWREQSWKAFPLGASMAYYRHAADGPGPYWTGVDSGFIVAVPVKECHPRVQAVFAGDMEHLDWVATQHANEGVAEAAGTEV